MSILAENALALVRFGGFRFGHFGGRGGGFGFVLIGLVLVGVVIWAVSRSSRSGSIQG
jgi:hypothetical protein